MFVHHWPFLAVDPHFYYPLVDSPGHVFRCAAWFIWPLRYRFSGQATSGVIVLFAMALTLMYVLPQQRVDRVETQWYRITLPKPTTFRVKVKSAGKTHFLVQRFKIKQIKNYLCEVIVWSSYTSTIHYVLKTHKVTTCHTAIKINEKKQEVMRRGESSETDFIALLFRMYKPMLNIWNTSTTFQRLTIVWCLMAL